MWKYNYTDNYLAHAGKKGMKWGYNDGKKNGKRTASQKIDYVASKLYKPFDEAGRDYYNEQGYNQFDKNGNQYKETRDGNTRIMQYRPKAGTLARTVDDVSIYLAQKGRFISKKIKTWTKTTLSNASKAVSKGVNYIKNLLKKSKPVESKPVESKPTPKTNRANRFESKKKPLTSSNPRSSNYAKGRR